MISELLHALFWFRKRLGRPYNKDRVATVDNAIQEYTEVKV